MNHVENFVDQLSAEDKIRELETDRDNLAAALQLAVNMQTEGSEFFACLPDEITFAAAKERREFFRLVDVANREVKKETT